MKIKRLLLIATITATMMITSVVPAMAETGAADAQEQILTETPADMQAAVNIKTVTPVVTAKSYSYNKVKLTWEAVSGADGYEVYRKTSKNGKFTKLASVASSKESYINTGLTCGKTYWYKVRAYKGSGGKKTYSKYSAVKSTYPRPSKVKGVTVDYTAYGYAYFNLNWSKTSGASGYQLQVKPASTGKWSSYYREKLTTGEWYNTYPDEWNKKKERTNVKYITLGTEAHWNLPSCEDSYSFRVRAYRTVNGKKVFGLYSEAFTIYPVWKSGEELQDFVHTWVDENYPTYDRKLEEWANADVYPEKDGVNWGTTWTWYTMSQYDTKEYVLKSLCEGTLKTYFSSWWGYENETTGILYTRDLGDGTWQVWWIN